MLRSLRSTLAHALANRRRYTAFKAEFDEYSLAARAAGTTIPTWDIRYPCLDDKTVGMGYEPHYTYHCAWACRELSKASPPTHLDISSSLQFAAMASAWVPVIHMDFRRPRIVLSGLETGVGNLLNLDIPTNSVVSLSCMHVIEHIGLGRYGDEIDPLGDAKAATELSRILAPGGTLLMVLPVGRARVNFNAHRVYSLAQAMALFPHLHVKSTSLVPDDFENGMIESPDAEKVAQQEWGCLCITFTKPDR